MDQAQLAGIIRHVSSLIGGILVAFGWLNKEDLATLTEALVVGGGSVLTIWAFFSSLKDKKVRGK